MVCANCGSTKLRPIRVGVVRLREHLAALLPRARVVAVESGSAPVPAFDVAIGTEAVLHRVARDPQRPVSVVAFLDFDQELLAPRYRAAEQALWLLVRASRQVGDRRGGGTVLVQARVPNDPVLSAARGVALGPVLETEIQRRRALEFPPFGGLAEISGGTDAVQLACDHLGADERVRIIGPANGNALVRAASVTDLCDALSDVDLSAARAAGRVRIDVDPLRV
jgi:primosomal protein N' (replication factor Y)